MALYMALCRQGHALSTPFGALKQTHWPALLARFGAGHALSTPFGALKRKL